MRKTSKFLGIVGGSLSALMAVIIILVGIFITSFVGTFLEDFLNSDYYENLMEKENIETYDLEDYIYDEGIEDFSTIAGAIVITVGIIFLIIAVLGIVGGAMAESSNVLGGVFMLISGLLALISTIGVIGGCLLIIGGIMAFVKEKPKKEENLVEA